MKEELRFKKETPPPADEFHTQFIRLVNPQDRPVLIAHLQRYEKDPLGIYLKNIRKHKGKIPTEKLGELFEQVIQTMNVERRETLYAHIANAAILRLFTRAGAIEIPHHHRMVGKKSYPLTSISKENLGKVAEKLKKLAPKP